MTQEVKVILGISIATIGILVLGVFFLSKSEQSKANPAPLDQTILTRNAKHTITSDSAKVTSVEFADFQCC